MRIASELTNDFQNIKRAYVNIHDFVRVQKAGGDVSKIKFCSYRVLKSDICGNWGRRFPLNRQRVMSFSRRC